MAVSEAAKPLVDLQPQKEFFVGIDSDGCAFDSMEPKHKECFCPNFVKWFNLACVSKFAREAWDFVNLYSKDRGCNRWLALMKALALVRERDEVLARNVKIPSFSEIQKFVDSGKPLSNTGLDAYIGEVGKTAELEQARNWTHGVNQFVADIVKGVPPYPHVRESLDKVVPKADIVVVSATPNEALQREWKEHRIDQHVRVIAGQEMGTKSEHLKLAAAEKYPNEKILMIGDAPGDRKAARSVNALFFPINPGNEAESWKRFHDEAFDKFVSGQYAGAYEEQLNREFDGYLPELPPWKRT